MDSNYTHVDVIPQEHALVVRERSNLVLTPVMDLATANKKLEEFQGFCAHYLQESADGGNDGGDYGVIPGTKKKTLLKSGADKLCEVYGIYDEYEFITTVENWDKNLFDYTVKCVLRSRRDDSLVGTGLGSCSSYESKYRYRDAQRKCPKCHQATIIKGKEEYGGGWLCFAKKGGCGAKFGDSDASIVNQTIGRVQNEDIADIKNTVLKMAKKRAKIDGVIGVTRSSGIFTQDMEDIPQPQTVTITPGTVNGAPKIETVIMSNDGWIPPEAEQTQAQPVSEPTDKKPRKKAKADPKPQPEPEAPALPLGPPPAVPPNGGAAKLPPKITDGQKRRLWAKAAAAGWKKDDVRALAQRIVINGQHLQDESDLPQGAQYYDRFISLLEKGPAQ